LVQGEDGVEIPPDQILSEANYVKSASKNPSLPPILLLRSRELSQSNQSQADTEGIKITGSLVLNLQKQVSQTIASVEQKKTTIARSSALKTLSMVSKYRFTTNVLASEGI
jgi:hypothetical protein